MTKIHALIQAFILLLLVVLGSTSAWSDVAGWSKVKSPVEGQQQVFQAPDLTLAARVLPITGGNIAFSGAGNNAKGKLHELHVVARLEDASTFWPSSNATNRIVLPNVPGRVQSRVNLRTGDSSSGWTHVQNRHFNPDKNASQFTVSQNELRTTLQSPEVVNSPVVRTVQSAEHGTLYVREPNLGRPIGTDKYNNFQPTSTMTVMTDRFGNLVTATPGVVR